MNKKDKLLAKIKKEFPSLKWKTAKFTDINWDFDVAILDNKYIFRFPRGAASQKKLKMELGVLKYLNKKVRLPIPNYIYVAKDLTFAGYKMIQGVGVSKERYKRLKGQEKDFIAKQLADFLNDMHATPLKIAKKSGVEEDKDLRDYHKLVSEVARYLFPRLNKQERADIENFLKTLETIYPIKNKVLTHGDLVNNNFLMKDRKISGIIDFSDMLVNDPAMDFSDLWDYGEKLVKKVYEKYRDKRDADLVNRSKLYYKRNSLRLMIIALNYKASPLSWTDSYKLFREMFYG